MKALKPFRLEQILLQIVDDSLGSLTDRIMNQQPVSATFIWTVNLSHLREVTDSFQTFDFFHSDCIITADGWPVKYLASQIAMRKVDRLTGVDLVHSLLKKGVDFGVIGSSRAQVETSLMRTNTENISQLSFIYDQKIDISESIQSEEILNILKIYQSKFVFICLGFPKQEILFDKLNSTSAMTPGYYLGVGGTFQLLSGEKLRAPKSIQRLGFEWIWRLAQDPQRLVKRYFSDARFFVKLIIKIHLAKILDRLHV